MRVSWEQESSQARGLKYSGVSQKHVSVGVGQLTASLTEGAVHRDTCSRASQTEIYLAFSL